LNPSKTLAKPYKHPWKIRAKGGKMGEMIDKGTLS